MRNLFLSMSMLVSMTACQNGENLTSNTSEEQQKQVFQSKAAARGEELPKLSAEKEKALIEDAKEYMCKVNEAGLKQGETGTERILCMGSGHACVWSDGYLVDVTWGMQTYNGGGGMTGTVPGTIQYHGTIVPRCRC